MRGRLAPAHGQRSFLFPPPTVEERIVDVPEYQKPLARKVEEERGNIRFALNYFLTHGTPHIQREADWLLQCVNDIDAVSLAQGVRNMHYPKELSRIRTAGFIALGTMHRALSQYWQVDPLHIQHAIHELLQNARPLKCKNAAKRTQAQEQWKRLHAGMQDLLD